MEGEGDNQGSKRYRVYWHESPAQNTRTKVVDKRFELEVCEEETKDRVYEPAGVNYGGDHLVEKYLPPAEKGEVDDSKPGSSSPSECYRDETFDPPKASNDPSFSSEKTKASSFAPIARTRLAQMTRANFRKFKEETDSAHTPAAEKVGHNSGMAAKKEDVVKKFMNTLQKRKKLQSQRKKQSSESEKLPPECSDSRVACPTPSTSIQPGPEGQQKGFDTSSFMGTESPILGSPLSGRKSVLKRKNPVDVSASVGNPPGIHDTPTAKRLRAQHPRVAKSGSPASKPSNNSTQQRVISFPPVSPIPPMKFAKSAKNTSPSNAKKTPPNSTSKSPKSPNTKPYSTPEAGKGIRSSPRFKQKHSTPIAGPPPAADDDPFDESTDMLFSQAVDPPEVQKRTGLTKEGSVLNLSSKSNQEEPSPTSRSKSWKRCKTFPEPKSPGRKVESEGGGMKATVSWDDSLDSILTDPNLMAHIDAKCAQAAQEQSK